MAFLSPNVEASHQTTERQLTAPYGLVILFALMLFCSGGIENGLGAWMATHFIFQGISVQTAANYTGMYWAAETIGRVLMTPLALRLSPFQLLVAGFSLEAVLLLLAHSLGLLFKPIFWLVSVWLHFLPRVWPGWPEPCLDLVWLQCLA